MTAAKHTNRLARETSPYLLQHAHNPVDWYPWGPEAFARAQAENRPILLSIGYSACHWCHVMERESFENEEIAAIMNAHFINIKVDREERPDVDAIYMSAVQLMTGQGGWPMTMFLTPDGHTFFGGTYFPPHDLYGRPGFPRVLQAVTTSWQTQREEIEEQSRSISAQLEEGNDLSKNLADGLLTPSTLDNAYNRLSGQFDAQYGGFGNSPKFPQPANLDFLLHYHVRSRRQEPLAMVEKTLQRMALGGIYDQLGGGFHRYSTDRTWLVPHFEKMLYDNAQLVQIYIRTYQATGKSFYRGIAEETLEYVMREMTNPDGGFYSAQDADSEGVEGKFFVWTPEEIDAILGERSGAIFRAFYDVAPGGNWEDKSILHVVMDAPETARAFGTTVEETAEILDGARITLLREREKRVKPGLDDKVLTSWNGLMLAAFAETAAILDRADFLNIARINAQFLLKEMSHRDESGHLRLLRTWRNGEAKLNGYLEDYAFLAEALLRLYEATFDMEWLETTIALTDSMLALFWDDVSGGFYATSSDHERLIQRPKDWDDNATPSGNSVAIEVLLRLALLTGNSDYRQHAARVVRKLGPVLEQHPYGFGRMLAALDFYLASPKEIAVIGVRTDPATQSLLEAVYRPYLPNRVITFASSPDTSPALVPWMADRPLRDDKPTAYVCENYTCKEPVNTPDALLRQLTTP